MDDLLDWPSLAEAGLPYPTGVPVTRVTEELWRLLADPDPVRRDDYGYSAAAAWIRGGHLDGELASLGDAAVERLGHPQVQARAFAPLILRAVLRRGLVAPAYADRWYAAFAGWYPHEPDTRGWDDELGWLHAVAHGADALAAFAPILPGRIGELLDLAARRMTAKDATSRYTQLEDARLARAITTVLLTPGVTETGATGWLATVREAFDDGGPGPVPIWAFNTFATLQSVHLHLTRGLADAGTPQQAALAATGVAAVLRLPYPWLG